MKALALDFDGVISDSAREAFCVALRAFVELWPDTPLAAHAAQPDPGRAANAALYAAFVEAMPLGNRAEDYAVVLGALASRRSLPDQAAYDRLAAGWEPAELARFHRRFYEIRHAWQERDPEGWRRLLAPYPPLLALLRRRAGDVALAIATAKDAQSVELLLRDYGIADLFPAGAVLDKETGVSKRAHLQALVRRLALAPGEITFVDDKLNHLEDVAGLGVRCALAAWGYNGPREWHRAEAAGFAVCRLEDLERQLFE